MSYFSPAYLKNQKLLPEPNSSQPALTMSAVEDEERDPLERERIKAAGEFRRERQQQHKQQQEPRFRMVKDPKTQLPTRYEAKEEEE
jgi:hypothetical protein